MMRLYSIRDAKTQAFSTPFFQQNDETALRMFRDELHGSNGPSMLSKHPEDFDLYCVGDWNDTSGAVRPTGDVDGPILVSKGADNEIKVNF